MAIFDFLFGREDTSGMQLDTQKLKELIGFHPHLCQQQVLAEQRRFNILDAGRRFGKTLLVSYIVIKKLLQKEQKAWVVAPTYDLTDRVFNYLQKYVRNFPEGMFTVEKSKKRITCVPTGSFVECKSSDNPESLLGEGLDLVVFDEASKERDNKIWDQYLRPTLLDRKGEAFFISTPTGKNWFWKLWQEAHLDEEWMCWKFTSYDNPYNDPEELDKIKAKTPKLIWLQEWMAEFIDGAGLVFSEIQGCVCGDLVERAETPDRFRYVIGWDPGKINDPSAVFVMDRTSRAVVHFDRFKDMDWPSQKRRVCAIADKFNKCVMLIDSTGGRDVLVDDLIRSGYPAKGFNYTNQSKKELINNLAVKLENWELTFPKIDILIEELENFSTYISQAGNVKYEAPPGFHDDCVNALALAVWELGSLKYTPQLDANKQPQYSKVY